MTCGVIYLHRDYKYLLNKHNDLHLTAQRFFYLFCLLSFVFQKRFQSPILRKLVTEYIIVYKLTLINFLNSVWILSRWS